MKKHWLIFFVLIFIVLMFLIEKSILPKGYNGEANTDKKEADNLLLVNKEHSLSRNYRPSDLTRVNVKTYPKTSSDEKLMRKEAAKALVELFEAAENSYKYGFILRHPLDKTDITGYAYESWHIRYVGKQAANEIYSENMVLEQYLEKQK